MTSSYLLVNPCRIQQTHKQAKPCALLHPSYHCICVLFYPSPVYLIHHFISPGSDLSNIVSMSYSNLSLYLCPLLSYVTLYLSPSSSYVTLYLSPSLSYITLYLSPSPSCITLYSCSVLIITVSVPSLSHLSLSLVSSTILSSLYLAWASTTVHNPAPTPMSPPIALEGHPH